MLAVYWNALEEAMNRRIVVVFVGIALIIGVASNYMVGFGTTPAGIPIVVSGSQSTGPYPLGVPVVLGQLMTVVGELWTFLTMFASVQILMGTLERGWLEILFSKATSRRRILLGRYLCGVSLFLMMAIVATTPLAARLWWTTGIATWQILVVALMQTLGFASLLAVAALASLLQQGVALPIGLAVGLWYFSAALSERATTYYVFVKSEFGRRIVDWVYYILPKCSELHATGAAYLQFSALRSSWALWTTGLFTVAVLMITVSLLERKSF